MSINTKEIQFSREYNMLTFLKNPRNLLLVGSLISFIGLGAYSWWTIGSLEDTIEKQEETIGELKEKNSRLELEVERKKLQITKLQDSVETQNEQVNKWKSEAQKYERQVKNAQQKAENIKQDLQGEIKELRNNRLTEESTCKESMDWMREKAMKELRDGED